MPARNDESVWSPLHRGQPPTVGRETPRPTFGPDLAFYRPRAAARAVPAGRGNTHSRRSRLAIPDGQRPKLSPTKNWPAEQPKPKLKGSPVKLRRRRGGLLPGI